MLKVHVLKTRFGLTALYLLWNHECICGLGCCVYLWMSYFKINQAVPNSKSPAESCSGRVGRTRFSLSCKKARLDIQLWLLVGVPPEDKEMLDNLHAARYARVSIEITNTWFRGTRRPWRVHSEKSPCPEVSRSYQHFRVILFLRGEVEPNTRDECIVFVVLFVAPINCRKIIKAVAELNSVTILFLRVFRERAVRLHFLMLILSFLHALISGLNLRGAR